MKPIEEITSANIDLNSFLSELVTKRDLLVKRLYSHRLEIQELQDRVSQVRNYNYLVKNEAGTKG